jgi:hypothetical protein
MVSFELCNQIDGLPAIEQPSITEAWQDRIEDARQTL